MLTSKLRLRTQPIRYTGPGMPEVAAELEAVTGPLKGNSIPLSEPEVSIGREPSNQVALLDSSVSRRHCLIRREEGQFKIKDLQSRNSTFVNGVPITERVLASGDEIRVGNSVLVFVLPEAQDTGHASSSVEYDRAE